MLRLTWILLYSQIYSKTATEEGAAPNTLEGRLEALRQKRAEDEAAQEEVLKKARVGLELGEDKPKASELQRSSDNLTVREREVQAKELLANSIPRMKNMVASNSVNNVTLRLSMVIWQHTAN